MDLLITNDDAGVDRSPEAIDNFEMVAVWLESRGLRATWFWVPKAGGRCGDDDPHWIPALRAARARGHDIQLHGLTHSSCLEFGLPQPATRRANPLPFEEHEAHRAHWQQEHSTAILAEKVEEAAAIYRRAFDTPPLVFRAPCFGIGSAAYEALAANGIRHSSSKGINPTATAYTLLEDPDLRRWEPDTPCRPYLVPPGVMEYPCLEDLTLFGVTAEQFDDRLDLYRSELAHIADVAGDEGVLVLGTHFQTMVKTWPQTRELFNRLLDWLPTLGVSRCLTFAQYLRKHEECR